MFPWALDGAVFARWVTDWLVPLLRTGLVVVLDNLSVHRSTRTRAAVEAAGG